MPWAAIWDRRRISIHVLRVEDDVLFFGMDDPGKVFQSTSSVWRTTKQCNTAAHQSKISIHVLRVEDDVCRESCPRRSF